MPWLAASDVGAAYGFARSIVGSRTEAELRHHALEALADLVPAEPAGAFDAVVGHARDHPWLAARVTRVIEAV